VADAFAVFQRRNRFVRFFFAREPSPRRMQPLVQAKSDGKLSNGACNVIDGVSGGSH
jgi:hypothetical protein